MYSYTLGGKKGTKQTLVESKDKIVVRTRNARPLHDAVKTIEGKRSLEDFKVDMEIPDVDVTVLKVNKDIKDKLEARDDARTSLKKEEELKFAGRVLSDKGADSPVLYTENIFIKFTDKIKQEVCERILKEKNLAIKEKLEYAVNSYFVSAPENTGLKIFEIAENLLKKKEVELCHPEIIRKKMSKSIHPKQWHLKKTTINGNQILANIKADKAHLLSQGENIIIAVIDDGTDIDNPEFNIAGKVVSSRDIFTNSNDPRPKYSDENHGTATAGVATAFGINASGVAPKANLMAIRNSSSLGSIKEANAFKWAVDHGADIISCSWGPEDGDWWDPNDPKHITFIGMADSTALAIEDAVTRGRNGKGCVIFFAAGNGNEDVQFDGYASYDKVIAVAASNDRNKRSVYSDFGDKIWCCFPSGDFEHQPFDHPSPLTTGIYTTDRRGSAGYNNQFDYCDDFGGTSSSCPGVAGIAALILSANSELTWLQVKEILKDSCEKIDTANGQYDSNGYSKFYGYGKPDAEKAVNKALLLKNNQAPQLKIISALVNPTGSDRGKEKISIKNNSATSVNLTGWKIQVKTKKQNLSGNIAAGATLKINIDNSKIKLANTGANILLLDNQNNTIDDVTYNKNSIESGVEVTF